MGNAPDSPCAPHIKIPLVPLAVDDNDPFASDTPIWKNKKLDDVDAREHLNHPLEQLIMLAVRLVLFVPIAPFAKSNQHT